MPLRELPHQRIERRVEDLSEKLREEELSVRDKPENEKSDFLRKTMDEVLFNDTFLNKEKYPQIQEWLKNKVEEVKKQYGIGAVGRLLRGRISEEDMKDVYRDMLDLVNVNDVIEYAKNQGLTEEELGKVLGEEFGIRGGIERLTDPMQRSAVGLLIHRLTKNIDNPRLLKKALREVVLMDEMSKNPQLYDLGPTFGPEDIAKVMFMTLQNGIVSANHGENSLLYSIGLAHELFPDTYSFHNYLAEQTDMTPENIGNILRGIGEYFKAFYPDLEGTGSEEAPPLLYDDGYGGKYDYGDTRALASYSLIVQREIERKKRQKELQEGLRQRPRPLAEGAA